MFVCFSLEIGIKELIMLLIFSLGIGGSVDTRGSVKFTQMTLGTSDEKVRILFVDKKIL